MAVSDLGKNRLLNAWDETGSTQGGAGLGATHMSLHTGNPGETGANEVSGGSYARKALTWGAAASGAKSITAAVTFDVPGSGTTITHVGLWSDLSSTDGSLHFIAGAALADSRTFTNAGTLEVSTATVTIPD